MSLNSILEKKNILHTLDKDELISMVHELLVQIKKVQNKSLTDKAEIRFIQKQMMKIKDNIDKIFQTRIEEEATWDNSKSKMYRFKKE